MIKKFLTITFAVVISISAFAQSTSMANVPTQVLNSFQTQHPAVTNVTWDQEGAYFMPSFTVNGVQKVAYIDLKGQYIQSIDKIAASNLPSAATIYISQNYQGGQISEVGKINFPNGNASRYYAKVNGKQLLFTNTGSFLKITASPLKQ